VFGIHDDLRGQEVHVAVVPHDGQGIDAEELIAFTRERIAAYKYPRVVHVVAELPSAAVARCSSGSWSRSSRPPPLSSEYSRCRVSIHAAEPLR